MAFITHYDPCIDLGGTTNRMPPVRWKRPIISALICTFAGHDWNAVGYAKADRYSVHDWRIGEYRCCTRCHARDFYRLETQEQFDQVCREEHDRWVKYALEKDREAAVVED